MDQAQPLRTRDRPEAYQPILHCRIASLRYALRSCRWYEVIFREALGTGQMFGTSRSVCSVAGNAHFAKARFRTFWLFRSR
jgi:hypothetical protein